MRTAVGGVGRRARILGTGSSTPDRVVTNDDLARMVDTSDRWIVERTGIRERRISGKKDTTSTLATRAAIQALEMAGIGPEDLDLIVVGTVTPDRVFPATACLVQRNLVASRAAAFDISAACSGFVFSLGVAESWLGGGGARTALVIGADSLSRIVNWRDRSTCVLFGDGAGAAVLAAPNGASRARREVLAVRLNSDGALCDILGTPAGPGSVRPSREAADKGLYLLGMNGREVFKHAVKAIADSAVEITGAVGLAPRQIDHFVLHQANLRIIEAVAKRIKVPVERFFVNLDRYGNTSSASVPIVLDEANRAGRIREGEHVLLASFGGGLTWGSVLVRW